MNLANTENELPRTLSVWKLVSVVSFFLSFFLSLCFSLQPVVELISVLNLAYVRQHLSIIIKTVN